MIDFKNITLGKEEEVLIGTELQKITIYPVVGFVFTKISEMLKNTKDENNSSEKDLELSKMILKYGLKLKEDEIQILINYDWMAVQDICEKVMNYTKEYIQEKQKISDSIKKNSNRSLKEKKTLQK